MNKLFGVILALVASIAIAFNANAMGPEHTGSWFNQSESGHGFSIEYGDAGNGTPLVVVYWYVYNEDGYPIFFTGYGYPDQSGVDIVFKAHWGMLFGEFDPSTHLEADGGVARFTFQDATNGTFEYIPSDFSIQNFGHSAHQMPITKLFAVTPPEPEIIEVPVNNALVSQLNDSWDGWDGDTIIELVNGQIWKQSQYHYEYTYSYRPNVVIYIRNGSAYASVEGSDTHVGVVRVQ